MAFSTLGKEPFVSFTNQSALNTFGTPIDNVVARNYHSLFVMTGAGVSAGVVAIQLSNDGVNWVSPASNTVTTNAASTPFTVTVGPSPFQYARAAITTVITGGTVTATVASA